MVNEQMILEANWLDDFRAVQTRLVGDDSDLLNVMEMCVRSCRLLLSEILRVMLGVE